jgi:hypothetical protein
MGYLRLRCQHAEDGRIDVIFGDAPNIHKLLQRVFIGYIAGVFEVSREKARHSGIRATNVPCQATTSNGV